MEASQEVHMQQPRPPEKKRVKRQHLLITSVKFQKTVGNDDVNH